MENLELFNYEKERLDYVIKLINEQIKYNQQKFDEQEHFIIGFKEGMRGTQFTRQSLMSLYATEVYNLKSVVSNPYFGMFKFVDDETKETQDIYLGKKTITDDNKEIVAHDWRKPICSMYYEYNIGDAKYQNQEEEKTGEILCKRQITIKDGELLSVDEQDMLCNDQTLLKYLNENASSRLKSIIATIQREQNRIIRSPLKRDYIVQGVAGSGKTTVALHRIAYLLFNEAKNIKESDFMILGPNKYFLNYISDLLPDLDIKNVTQNTFLEIALDNLGCKVKIETKNDTLQKVLEGKSSKEIIKFKSSIEYLELLRKFIEYYMSSNLSKNITYADIEICSKEKLETLFDNYLGKKGISYSEKINTFIKSLIKNVKENSDDLAHDVWLKYRDEFLNLPKGDKRREEILDITNEISKEIKSGCANEIKEFFKFVKINPLNLYKLFIENIDKIKDIDDVDIELLKTSTLERLNKRQIGYEDLAPLMYINYLFNGVKEYNECSHLVIDEAQDLSMSQYYMLKNLFPNCYFDIYGDVNQSIYAYEGIQNWDELNNVIFDSSSEMLELNKSYRTTKQISDASNLILEYLNCDVADCISREGSNIYVNNIEGNNFVVILEQIKELLDKGYGTVAIICKDDKECEFAYKTLKKLGLDIEKISEKNNEYHGGVCIMPTYLSKGLEFDATILFNANDINYQENEIDMKLLYVAITRAMHELYINYSGNLPVALKSLEEESTLSRR